MTSGQLLPATSRSFRGKCVLFASSGSPEFWDFQQQLVSAGYEVGVAGLVETLWLWPVHDCDLLLVDATGDPVVAIELCRYVKASSPAQCIVFMVGSRTGAIPHHYGANAILSGTPTADQFRAIVRLLLSPRSTSLAIASKENLRNSGGGNTPTARDSFTGEDSRRGGTGKEQRKPPPTPFVRRILLALANVGTLISRLRHLSSWNCRVSAIGARGHGLRPWSECWRQSPYHQLRTNRSLTTLFWPSAEVRPAAGRLPDSPLFAWKVEDTSFAAM